MSIADRLRSVQVTPRVAVFSIIGLVVVLSGVVMTVKKMADTSPIGPASPKHPSRSAGVDVKVDEKKGKAGEAVATKSEDVYAVIVDRDLFRPVTAASLAQSAAEGTKKQSSAAAPTPKPPTQVPPMPVPAPTGNIDEVKKNIAFTGAVRLAGSLQALLENLQSKEAKFVGQGESAFGYRVMNISSQLVVLEKNGLQFSLALGENKVDAPAKPAGGQPGQPGQPGGPEGQPHPGG